MADLLEPIEDSRLVRFGVQTAFAMPPKSLAGDDVLLTVSVDIGHLHRLHFGEFHTVLVLARLLVDDEMTLELSSTLLILQLLPPRQAIAVSDDGGHYVRQAIVIYVIDMHLRSTVDRDRRWNTVRR